MKNLDSNASLTAAATSLPEIPSQPETASTSGDQPTAPMGESQPSESANPKAKPAPAVKKAKPETKKAVKAEAKPAKPADPHANPYRKGGNYYSMFNQVKSKRVLSLKELIDFSMQNLKDRNGNLLSLSQATASSVVIMSPHNGTGRGDLRGNLSSMGHLYYMHPVTKRAEDGSKRFQLCWREKPLELAKRGSPKILAPKPETAKEEANGEEVGKTPTSETKEAVKAEAKPAKKGKKVTVVAKIGGSEEKKKKAIAAYEARQAAEAAKPAKSAKKGWVATDLDSGTPAESETPVVTAEVLPAETPAETPVTTPAETPAE